MKTLHAVIMAGGGGTRLWPLSRRSRPKQSLRIFDGKALFQMAVERLHPIIPPERIHVVTVAEQADMLKAINPAVPTENYIIEPEAKGTAPVVGLAAMKLREIDTDAVMACLPADHFIAKADAFQEVVLAAAELACEGDLVTIGITPAFASTAFGYIHRGEARGSYRGMMAYKVKAFREKPPLLLAESYVIDGEHSWNSGMFVWRAQAILERIESLMPALHEGLMKVAVAVGKSDEKKSLEREWHALERQTIDYGVMERAQDVSVIPAGEIGWWDIGNWEGLFAVLGTNSHGNLDLARDWLAADTRRTLVFQDRDRSTVRFIATLGVEDLIVVDTGDVLLICPRKRAEEVKDLVEVLSSIGKDQFL